MNVSAYLRAITIGVVVSGVGIFSAAPAHAQHPLNDPNTLDNDDVHIVDSKATLSGNSVIIFEQTVAGIIGGTPLTPFGQFDGAPVLGFVFPTNLSTTDIGFNATAGTVALAVTAHPDFDDTPDVDEDGDGNKINPEDGGVLHSHWVVLWEDPTTSITAVKPLDENDANVITPDTWPGLPLYIDSPNFFVEAVGDTLSVHVPVEAVNDRIDFTFSALTAYLEPHVVETGIHEGEEPLLGVYMVFSSFGSDLPVPEPASAAVFTLGLAGLASIRRRR